MAIISRVTTWSDGQALTAAALNGEMNDIFNDYNGNITDANISESANIAQSKLATLSITESLLSTSDITTADVSTTKHGFVPKAPNDTTKFLRGDATWAVPTSSPVTGLATITSNQTTSSTSLVDLTGASVSITTTVTCNIYVVFTCETFNNGIRTNTFKLFRGATGLTQNALFNAAAAAPTTFSMSHLDTSVAAGTYTYKVQWMVDNGTSTGTVVGAAVGNENSRLIVIAHPA